MRCFFFFLKLRRLSKPEQHRKLYKAVYKAGEVGVTVDCGKIGLVARRKCHEAHNSGRTAEGGKTPYPAVFVSLCKATSGRHFPEQRELCYLQKMCQTQLPDRAITSARTTEPPKRERVMPGNVLVFA